MSLSRRNVFNFDETQLSYCSIDIIFQAKTMNCAYPCSLSKFSFFVCSLRKIYVLHLCLCSILN